MRKGLTAPLAGALLSLALAARAQTPTVVRETQAAPPHPSPQQPAPRPQPPAPRPQPPRPQPPTPHPNPPPPNPHPRPNPPPPNPHPRPNPPPPNPRPHPRPNPNPPPPHPRPRPVPVPVPEPWPYPSPYPPCRFGCQPNEYFISPDGTRAVWLQSGGRDAYLYDRTVGGFPPRWLEWDVRWVDWIMDGAWLTAIRLTRWDGQVDYFDRDGNRIIAPETALDEPVEAPVVIRHDLGKAFEKAPAFQSLVKEDLGW